MIFVILTNTEICNVHISMILEGLEYSILSRKSFTKVTQIGVGVHLPWVDVHSAIYETYLV